jgi:hypothetical protein
MDATSDTAYAEVADKVIAVSVADDDVCGVVVVESNGSTMVTEAATTDTFTVALEHSPAGDGRGLCDQQRHRRGDCQPSSVDVHFSNWSTTQTVTVTGVDDATADANQSPNVTLAIVDASSDACFDPSPDFNVPVTVSDDRQRRIDPSWRPPVRST